MEAIFRRAIGTALALRLRGIAAETAKRAQELDARLGGDLKPLVTRLAYGEAARRIQEAVARELADLPGPPWETFAPPNAGDFAAKREADPQRNLREVTVVVRPWQGTVELGIGSASPTYSFGPEGALENWAPLERPDRLADAVRGLIDPLRPWSSAGEALEGFLAGVQAIARAGLRVYEEIVAAALADPDRAYFEEVER